MCLVVSLCLSICLSRMHSEAFSTFVFQNHISVWEIWFWNPKVLKASLCILLACLSSSEYVVTVHYDVSWSQWEKNYELHNAGGAFTLESFLLV